jgi:hypothetical protein
LARRFGEQLGLRMTGAIMSHVLSVFGFEENSATAAHQYRAERPVAMLPRTLRDHKRIT